MISRFIRIGSVLPAFFFTCLMIPATGFSQQLDYAVPFDADWNCQTGVGSNSNIRRLEVSSSDLNDESHLKVHRIDGSTLSEPEEFAFACHRNAVLVECAEKSLSLRIDLETVRLLESTMDDSVFGFRAQGRLFDNGRFRGDGQRVLCDHFFE